ncbi:type VI secretion system secreted protein VgrG [Povalibacter uvarum]|uniref:Type VI secretion system secreted protein VgrG n=1 Tax=Povalibacter uvarum TaxID=732238 RepID=A0A841HI14_9GAMM|nr:type VI secretion system tip protein VgrG [Povalibacter uvarum]MBB6091950.1 type VI secretion system secreted protein VgrG [Povalibacter uvarum]
MSRKITLKSPLAADQLLIRSATVTEQLGQPFEIDLELLSPDENIDFDKLLGKEITLGVGLDSGSSRYFHAFIAEFGQVGRLGEYATYRARAVPWLWFLTRTANCRIFQNKSVPEIIKQVFRDRGYTNIKDALTKTYRTREYCVQYRETDFNFVQRLMEEEGIYYFFTHTESTHTLVLADSYSGHSQYPDYGTIEYFPPSDNAIREKDHIHDWQRQRNVQPGKYVVMDYDFQKPRAVLKTQYVQKRNFPKSDSEVFDYPGGFIVSTDGDHYARARLESLQSQYERMNGVGNARGLATGSLFKLSGYPRKDQNKEYLITSATHRVHAGDYQSGTGGTADDYTCSFESIDAKEPFRAPITTRKPIVGGPQTATVTGPGGEEIHTDKYGRVKVQFHWDREGQRDEKSSCWVRVSQIWAGKNWGWMSIPRMGQEVVVDFLEGDPDQPLITGRVYNADNMPPFELPANKTQSGLRTRSTLNGTPANFNELRFEDKKGSEQVYLHAEKNQDIEVEADETHWVGHNRAKTIDNDETTHVKHDRTETVDNNESITIGVNRTENVGSNESITIGSNRTENVGADESITVGSNRTESVGSNETVSIGSNQSITVGSNRTLDVGGNETTTVGGNRDETVAKNESVSVGKSRTVSIGENDGLSVGKQLVIDVADQIVIKTGSASITMKKDGTIVIKGKDITLDGSGKINVKASSDVVVKGSKITQN